MTVSVFSTVPWRWAMAPTFTYIARLLQNHENENILRWFLSRCLTYDEDVSFSMFTFPCWYYESWDSPLPPLVGEEFLLEWFESLFSITFPQRQSKRIEWSEQRPSFSLLLLLIEKWSDKVISFPSFHWFSGTKYLTVEISAWKICSIHFANKLLLLQKETIFFLNKIYVRQSHFYRTFSKNKTSFL